MMVANTPGRRVVTSALEAIADMPNDTDNVR